MSYLLLSVAHLSSGNSAEAEKAARKVIELAPESSAGYAYLANVLRFQEKYLESFEALKEEYSDDRDPQSGEALGPYVAVNDGVRRERLDEIPRRNFHPVLRHLIFRLEVDEVAMADWHEKDCPDGWHVVTRLK